VIEIDANEARRLRARSQLLGGSGLAPADVVARAGAMQGQDLGSVLRAIALRCAPGTTLDDVRAAFDAGQLVRGWPMRGTLFALTPEDLAGFARLTGPRMQTSLRARRGNLGLEDRHFELAREVAVAALEAGPIARDELASRWHDAGVPEGAGLDYHFTSTLAIDGVLALGPFDGRDQLVVRIGPPREDEAAFLARIARAFFAARGPASIDDFAWWTKLPKSLLRPAALAVDGIETISVEGRPMLHLDDGGGPPPSGAVALVPGFDEWVLGYQDRSLVGSKEALAAVATVNGIFRPAVLLDGRIVGTWRPKDGAALVERVNAAAAKAIDAAIAAWPFG